MARSLSALPRRALINCRRSVSLSGRKSIDVLLPENRASGIGTAGNRASSPSLVGCQRREQLVHSAVHSFFRNVGGEQLAIADHIVPGLLSPDNYTDSSARFCQGHFH